MALCASCLVLSSVTIAAALGALHCDFYPRFALGGGGAQGYDTGRRTRFALFRFRGRDVALCASCLILSGVTIAAAALGALGCDFYPRFALGGGGALGAAGYTCYALLALAPAILEWEERLRWKALRSGA